LLLLFLWLMPPVYPLSCLYAAMPCRYLYAFIVIALCMCAAVSASLHDGLRVVLPCSIPLAHWYLFSSPRLSHSALRALCCCALCVLLCHLVCAAQDRFVPWLAA